MSPRWSSPGVPRRLVVAGACATAVGGFVRQSPVIAVDHLVVFDLPLVIDLIQIGDRVSVIGSPRGGHVRWKGRMLGSVSPDASRRLRWNAHNACWEATIARCVRLGERAYVLEVQA